MKWIKAHPGDYYSSDGKWRVYQGQSFWWIQEILNNSLISEPRIAADNFKDARKHLRDLTGNQEY
jgi:hypothetical protein